MRDPRHDGRRIALVQKRSVADDFGLSRLRAHLLLEGDRLDFHGARRDGVRRLREPAASLRHGSHRHRSAYVGARPRRNPAMAFHNHGRTGHPDAALSSGDSPGCLERCQGAYARAC